MVKKPAFKTIVSDDKIVFELSIEYLRAEVAHYNWRTIQLNRREPREMWTCFRVTNGKMFMKYMLRYLTKGRELCGDSLQYIVTHAIAVALETAPKKGAGIVELPWGSKDAEGRQPAKRR